MEAFITGGAGYLGRALLKAGEPDPQYVIFSRDEHKQWKLRSLYPTCRFILGNVQDMTSVVSAMPYQVPVVIHAAAHKFVPEGELDAIEFAKANVDGTYNVGLAAGLNRARIAVFISTDKAINPVNNYGATKMIGERMWLELNVRFPETKFVVVRYGNVIGSTGSVVELFRKQLAEKQVVMVTDEECTRFWMTSQDAVKAVWWTASQAPRGTIVVPLASLCHSTIADLLTAMDIRIEQRHYIGLRPGEKVHEDIVSEREIGHSVLDSSGNLIIDPRSRPTDWRDKDANLTFSLGDGKTLHDYQQGHWPISSKNVRACSETDLSEMIAAS